MGDLSYTFSSSGLYRCPPNSDTATVEDFKAWVDEYPLSEQPEVFGMHDNANISFMQQEAERTLNVVLSIQPREAGGSSAKSPEDIVIEIAQDQQSRLPAALSAEDAHPMSFKIIEETGMMTSIGTCLTQEMARFNGLQAQIGKTLGLLQKAVKGLIVMTQDLDDMFSSELNNQVPAVWTKGGVGYPSLKPMSSWYDDMILRFTFFADWIKNGLPISYWVSSFYFPQGFLTSVLQGYSRSNVIPVDQLSFEFQMEDTPDPEVLEEPPAEGIFIHGIFMDGVAWDYQEMVIGVQEFGVMFVRCPIINMIPVKDKVPNPERYSMPFYKTSVRAGTLSTTGHSTNYVLSVEVETNETPNFWVLKGAALLSMLND